MGFLQPLGLILAAAVAIPLLLHLLHRTERERISFPALRYLLRTEREHSRRIRMRQWLLLALRIAVLLLFALAAAQAVLRGGGAAHPATGVVLVLDNSMSSGRVVGQGRVLDTLRARAEQTLELAGAGDRFWVLRAGSPWETVSPMGAAEALVQVQTTEVSAAFADLGAALQRAERILARAEVERGEIHLLSDLQTSAFPTPPAEMALPVVVWGGSAELETVNGYVQNAIFGGGLAPRAGRRTEVAVTLGGDAEAGEERSVRVILDDQLRGAVRTLPGRTAILAVGPFGAGPLEGIVEADADALRADDQFHVRIAVVPPPRVAVLGDPGPFVLEALQVLVESDRISLGGTADAQVILAAGGQLPARLEAGTDLVVIPPLDPALRPGLSRRLAELGIPVALDPEIEGETRVDQDQTGADLEGVAMRNTGPVRPTGPGRRWVTLEGGDAWLVRTQTAAGTRATVLGSALLPERTDVPISAGMVPLLEWLVGPGDGVAAEARRAGDTLRVSSRATEIEVPDGTRVPIDGTLEFRQTDQTGFYTVLAGDTVLDRVALNAPSRESLLQPWDPDRLVRLLGADSRAATTADQWVRRVFVERQGREFWRPLLLLALLLLIMESWVASSGGITEKTTRTQPRVHDP